MVDLKTPFTLGHSAGVAELAGAAAGRLRLPDDDRRPGPPGRRCSTTSGGWPSPASVWEKPGPLTPPSGSRSGCTPTTPSGSWPAPPILEPLARIAGMHHERQDGSGYHRGASGGEVPAEARLLAVADAYQAMTAGPPATARPWPPRRRRGSSRPRPGRAGSTPSAPERSSRPPASAPPASRSAWPAGLSDREVEVLRLLARGLSNRQIAAALVISPRTAEHHVQHIYTKIGVSTRAAAAMFAMEHGLLR